jgi:hypothetical protein
MLTDWPNEKCLEHVQAESAGMHTPSTPVREKERERGRERKRYREGERERDIEKERERVSKRERERCKICLLNLFLCF